MQLQSTHDIEFYKYINVEINKIKIGEAIR